MPFPLGTSVNVYGTIAVQTSSDTGAVNPTWLCFVDGTEIAEVNPTFAFPENNWSLCNVAEVADGEHILTANISFSVTGPTFWVDYILYVPSPSEAPTGPDVIRVDNTDPEIVYSGAWSAVEHSNVTQTAGSQVTFDFTGKSFPLHKFSLWFLKYLRQRHHSLWLDLLPVIWLRLPPQRATS